MFYVNLISLALLLPSCYSFYNQKIKINKVYIVALLLQNAGMKSILFFYICQTVYQNIRTVNKFMTFRVYICLSKN